MDLRNFVSRVLGGCGSKCVVEKIFRRRPETNLAGGKRLLPVATRLDSHTTRGTLRVLCTIVQHVRRQSRAVLKQIFNNPITYWECLIVLKLLIKIVVIQCQSKCITKLLSSIKSRHQCEFVVQDLTGRSFFALAHFLLRSTQNEERNFR